MKILNRILQKSPFNQMGSRGFALLENLIAAGILGGVSLMVFASISDTNKIYSRLMGMKDRTRILEKMNSLLTSPGMIHLIRENNPKIKSCIGGTSCDFLALNGSEVQIFDENEKRIVGTPRPYGIYLQSTAQSDGYFSEIAECTRRISECPWTVRVTVKAPSTTFPINKLIFTIEVDEPSHHISRTLQVSIPVEMMVRPKRDIANCQEGYHISSFKLDGDKAGCTRNFIERPCDSDKVARGFNSDGSVDCQPIRGLNISESYCSDDKYLTGFNDSGKDCRNRPSTIVYTDSCSVYSCYCPLGPNTGVSFPSTDRSGEDCDPTQPAVEKLIMPHNYSCSCMAP